MTANSDELRRQLRLANSEQREALPLFRRALRRSSDPEAGVDPREQAALLGVPHSRRGFLRLGGVTVAASAVLVACGSDDTTVSVTRTGDAITKSTAEPPSLEPGAELDVTLLLTASSIESLAIAAYDDVLANGWLGDAALNQAAELFRDQHIEHREVIDAAVRGLGETPYNEPNPFLLDNVVAPAAAEIAALEPGDQQLEALELALQLEDVAAQTYTSAGGLFTSPDLRQAGMSIGAVEARHVAVILGVLEYPQAPFAFGRTTGAVAEDAFITTDGPVTESEA